MSSPIWTPAALSSEVVSFEGKSWRLVEAQHRVSTLKLTDSLEEQSVLEQTIEDSKPNVPLECRHLDYLLATPFRYGSYPHGSRFRRAGHTPGVFYASEKVETAVAEMAFYRLLFFLESPATEWPKDAAEYTAFSAAFKAERAIDLTRPPLDRDVAIWTDPLDYSGCQQLGETARQADMLAIRYGSVRDPKGGANLALLRCLCFAKPRPVDRQTWRIRLSATGVHAICEFPDKRIGFDRAVFARDPRIDRLNWNRK